MKRSMAERGAAKGRSPFLRWEETGEGRSRLGVDSAAVGLREYHPGGGRADGAEQGMEKGSPERREALSGLVLRIFNMPLQGD